MHRLYIFLTLLLTSCSFQITPLQGKYQDGPYMVETSKSKEEVWDRIIDIFAQKGLPIKIIDKGSGLIVSEKTHLLASWEDRNGKLKEPKAFLAVPTYGKGTNKIHPGIVIGEWNIRIKEVNNKTLVNVNVVNLKWQYDTSKGRFEDNATGVKSTGVFEKMIADLII